MKFLNKPKVAAKISNIPDKDEDVFLANFDESDSNVIYLNQPILC